MDTGKKGETKRGKWTFHNLHQGKLVQQNWKIVWRVLNSKMQKKKTARRCRTSFSHKSVFKYVGELYWSWIYPPSEVGTLHELSSVNSRHQSCGYTFIALTETSHVLGAITGEIYVLLWFCKWGTIWDIVFLSGCLFAECFAECFGSYN